MITNERQYRISKRKLRDLKVAIAQFDSKASAKAVGSEVLSAAELEALRSEADVLLSEISEYEKLKSGGVSKFEAESLGELPKILIRARIARGMSQKKLAELVGLKEQQIQRYEADEYSSASLRRLREIADALNLKIAEAAQVPGIPPSKTGEGREELEWSRFPVREMYRRGWFAGFSGSLDDAVRNAEFLARQYVTSYLSKPSAALHRIRVRSGSSVDEYALLAWECRVIDLARRIDLPSKYQAGSLTSEWMTELARVSVLPDGPTKAKTFLQNVGLILVVEPHLPGTHLDGAAILSGDIPVIGMTLRYDRLDNFWFVLFHEIVHVAKHLRKGAVEGVFDDLDASGQDTLELEADKLAGESLVPESEWSRSLARFLRTADSVVMLAQRLRISPAIVAGRVRHESRNFVILSELVGAGEVRKHFSEALFGI